MRWPVYMMAFVFLFSCSLIRQKEKEKTVARVYDKYLYESDIQELVKPGTSEEDSILLVNNYIQNWIRQNLLLHKAEQNLTEDKKDVEKQLRDYRNSLVIFAYEKELVSQQLDTVVTDEEIAAYYEKNKHNFELKDYIVRIVSIKLEKNSPNLRKAKKWFYSNKEKDRLQLEEYSHKYAVNFYLDEDTWIYFDDVLKQVPLEVFNKEEFLNKNSYVEFEDEQYVYLLKIIDFKLKDSISPLSLEKENIRNIIINKRKIELISRMKKEVYENALSRNHFEIYD